MSTAASPRPTGLVVGPATRESDRTDHTDRTVRTDHTDHTDHTTDP